MCHKRLYPLVFLIQGRQHQKATTLFNKSQGKSGANLQQVQRGQNNE